MILNALVFALRNLRKNKLLAAINVLGLTIGISACLVIFLIVSYELSFNKGIADGERIYRIYTRFSGVFTGLNRGVSTGVASGIKETISGIESSTSFFTMNGKVFIVKPNVEPTLVEGESRCIMAGPEFFDVFTNNEWIIGNPTQSLSDPNKVVLTESRAKLIFGNLSPAEIIGKQLIYRDSIEVAVSGILKDSKENSDFNFTDILSLKTNETLSEDNRVFHPNDWGSTNSSSQFFVKLSKGTTASDIEKQMPKVVAQYKEREKDSDWTTSYPLQALADIHFNTEIGIMDSSRSVSEKSTFQVMSIIAMLLLAIAVINFVNLETAQASKRAKEVGVRKVLGSSRVTLIGHFMIESFILTFCAVLCSLLLSYFSIIWFSEFIPKGVDVDLTNPVVQIFLVGCLIGVSLLAGIYPAFVLSSFQPALALKNQAFANSSTTRSSFIRKALTVFQFSFSQLLIIATIAIGMQIHYMLNKDLGFRSDAVITFWTPWKEPAKKRQVLKNELERLTSIDVLSTHSSPPSSSGSSSTTMEFNNGKEVLKHNVYIKNGDPNYLELYKLTLVAGSNITAGDSGKQYIINETYAKLLGFENPVEVIGKTVHEDKVIVGVAKDFHTKSLRTQIEPLAIYNEPENQFMFGVRFNSHGKNMDDLKAEIGQIEKVWEKIYPDTKFAYTFVDETIRRFYETEQRTSRLARTATIIAIIISCLGLFGLSSFTVIQRTKEIGIRKVLGATVNSILFLLTKDFVVLVMVAFVIAGPLAFYFIEDWLTKYAYRMDISWWLFAIAGLASVITAFLTVSFRTVKAAKADPVKSLRYE
jgi:putative ABC transport system permease protein